MNNKAPRPLIAIREDLAPLYIVSFTGVPTDEQFDAHLERLTRITMRREVRAMIYDASAGAGNPASHRKKMAEWLARHQAQIRQYSVGTAFVLSSPITRAALTAVLWMQPMPCPHRVTATVDEAIKWCGERLAERGRPSLLSESQGM